MATARDAGQGLAAALNDCVANTIPQFTAHPHCAISAPTR